MKEMSSGSAGSFPESSLMVDWHPYLESVCKKYAQWWRVYTFTDVVGRAAVEKDEAESEIPFMDLGLMAQTVVKSESPNESDSERKELKEKIERFSVLDGLRKYAPEHVLLVGRPGSGKSTSLLRLLIEAANALLERRTGQEYLGIPILVELRYLQTSIEDLIRNFLKRNNLLLKASEIEQLLFDGELLLLIDGVNELPSAEARRQLQVFCQAYSKTPMVITTRELELGGNLGTAKKLEMQPLSELQMRQFVQRYLPDEGEKLLRQLRDRFQSFGQTPLLLWMLCSLFKATGKIPRNLGLVFRQFTKSYEKQLWANISLDEESQRWWPSLLQELSFTMMQGDNLTETKISTERLAAEKCLADFFVSEQFNRPLDRAKIHLKNLLQHHLIQYDPNGQIEFRHQLIQEYYSAEYLLGKLESINDIELKNNYLNYFKWTEVFTLVVRLTTQKKIALRIVNIALSLDPVLGMKLAGSAREEFQNSIMNSIVAQNFPIRYLGYSHSEVVVPALRNALLSDNYCDRWMALWALGDINHKSAVKELEKSLFDSDKSISRRALLSLRNIKTRRVLKIFISLFDEVDQYLVREASEYLYAYKSKESIQILIESLKSKNSLKIKASLKLLANERNKNIALKILPLLDFLDSEIVELAITALGAIGDPVASNRLVEKLKDKRPSVREKSVKALGSIGGELALKGLVKYLDAQDSPLKKQVVLAIGSISQQSLDSILTDIENHGSAQEIIEGLSKIKSKTALKVIIDIALNIGSPSNLVAIQALGNYKSPETEELLISLLTENRDPYVREKASLALSKVGTKRSLLCLRKTLQGKHKYLPRKLWHATLMKEWGLAILAKDDLSRVSKISWFKKNDDWNTRKNSAVALGLIGDLESEEALIKALCDRDKDVRYAAINALGQIKSGKSVPEVIKVLEDKFFEDFHNRGAAATALGKIGLASAKSALMKAVINEDVFVRKRAILALTEIDDELPVERLLGIFGTADFFLLKLLLRPYVNQEVMKAVNF